MTTRTRRKSYRDLNSEASSDDHTLSNDTDSEKSSQTGEAPGTDDDDMVDDADATVVDFTAKPIPGYQELYLSRRGDGQGPCPTLL